MSDTDQATRYRRIKRLGVGGMASVTLAHDTLLARPVALKRVHSGGGSRDMLRLKREALVGASLSHPNLVFVYDVQLQDDGDVVIVMEYVDGETLADVLASRGALSAPEVIRVLRGIAAALDAIHERGIVHRDVKPANVLLGRDGTIKLADLGVADVADRTRITESGALVGSFGYMAPEQLDGDGPSPAMDIYALAVVAYEMLAGEKARPETNPLALAHAIPTQPAPDLRRAWPQAPAATAAVLRRAMSADPAQRPATAGEFVRRLEATLEPRAPARYVTPDAGRTAPAAFRSRPPAGTPRRGRPVLVPALLALAVLAVAGIVAAALGSGGKQPAASTSANRTAGHRSATAAPGHSITATTHSTPQSTPAATPSTTTTGSTAAASSTTTSPPISPGGSPSPGSPANAVEQFYTAAARHQYAAAWALADANLHNELRGYSAFQSQMSAVRSITFHRAETTQSTSSTATVAVSTTSVQSDRTHQCAGTARTVRSGGGWLLDGISINCS